MNRDDKVSPRTISAYRKFLKLLPKSSDRELIILKAHLLIEEQVWLIVSERVENPTAIERERISFSNICAIARAFFPEGHDPLLWNSISKLNRIRNNIAHQLEPKKIDAKLSELVEQFSPQFIELEDDASRLELTLSSMFVTLADLVEKPSAGLLNLVSSEDDEA